MTDLSIAADAVRNRLVRPETAVHAGYPVSFAGTLGFIHPGHARRGVVMVGPWGYEGLCLSRAWRALAGSFAAADLPTIRFDLPGTGDGLGDHHLDDPVAHWIAAVDAAAQTLRRHHSVDEIVLAGFSVGCLIAAAAAEKIAGVSRCVMLAPSLSGREYLRELTIRGQLIDDYLGRWPEDVAEEGVLSIAGFHLSAAAASSLKALKLTAGQFAGLGSLFLADRPGYDSREKLSALLPDNTAITTAAFEAYPQLTFDPTAADAPVDLWAEAARYASAGLTPRAVDFSTALIPRIDPLVGTGFKETAMRFGPDSGLFGVLTEPAGASRAVVILLNTGRSPHIGWARAAVEQARTLALSGISTLRMDISSVGDSLARVDGEILYNDASDADIAAALDLLAPRGLGPIVVVGGCSGAYAALGVAARDGRISGVGLVNIQRFVWDPRESVAEAMAAGVRTVGAQSRQMLSLRQWKRLLTGEIRADKIAFSILKQVIGLGEAVLVRMGLPVSPLAKVRQGVLQRFDALAARHVPVRLMFGTADRGLEEVRRHFGKSGDGLKRWPLVSTQLIANTDHNITPPRARAAVCQGILDLVEAATASARPASGGAVAAPRPIKVLMVQTQAENAGAQEISRLVGAGLDQRGFESHHLFFYRRTAGLDGLPNRVDCAAERPQGLFQTLKLFYRIAREIRRIRPDVVLTFQHYGNLFGAVLTRLVSRAPVIANQVSADGVTNRVIRTADRFLGSVGLYRTITVNSDETMRSFLSHPARYQRRIAHVPHGFEAKSSDLGKAEARAVFGLPADVTLIGSAARLHPMKQLDAAIRLLNLRPDWHLAIAGQGADEPRLRALAEELKVADRLHLVGELKPAGLGRFFAALDVFVFPSLAETFGLAAVEAAQAGIPVVANHLDVLREVLQADGVPAALFVDASDTAALEGAVSKVISDPILQLQLTTAGQKLKERYSLDAMVDAYQGLIGQALGGKQ